MYDLFCFENSGEDLVIDLLKAAGQIELVDSLILNPTTIAHWNNSNNKKIVLIATLQNQMSISLKKKNWLFKYFNESVFFDKLLCNFCATFSNETQSVLIQNIDDFVHSTDKDLKKRLITDSGDYLKKILNKEKSLIYKLLFDRFGTVENGREVFAGYKNSVDLQKADVVIYLETLLKTNGKNLFDQLSINYKQEYKDIINRWKEMNLNEQP